MIGATTKVQANNRQDRAMTPAFFRSSYTHSPGPGSGLVVFNARDRCLEKDMMTSYFRCTTGGRGEKGAGVNRR